MINVGKYTSPMDPSWDTNSSTLLGVVSVYQIDPPNLRIAQFPHVILSMQ